MIYFIQNGDAVKIGVTIHDARDRLAYLQTATPHKLTLLGHIEGSYDEERALHRRFAHLRIRNEWFRLTRELIEFIAEVTRQNEMIEFIPEAADPWRYCEPGRGDLPTNLTVAGAENVQVQIDDRGIWINQTDAKPMCVFRLTGIRGWVELQDSRQRKIEREVQKRWEAEAEKPAQRDSQLSLFA
jgi:hypothetical protein